jgi:O-methyltransferase
MGMARTLLAAAKGAINRGLAPLGFSLDRISRPVLSTVDPSIRDTVARVGGFTMTTPERIIALCDAVRHVVKHNVPGDIVECGVWRGGSMMAAAFTLMQLDARRHLHLFDTFAGMPAASDDKDIQIEDGIPANVLRTAVIQETGAWAYASEDDVRRNMASTGYETSFIHLHKGMVEETLPREAPAQIAILRLDTDWYDSTRHELEHLWPGLSIGGVLIIDDYGHFSGAQLATDEFFSDKNALLFRIDYAARMIIKQI